MSTRRTRRARCTYTITENTFGIPGKGWEVDIAHPNGETVSLRFGRSGGEWVYDPSSRDWRQTAGTCDSPDCRSEATARRLAREARTRFLPY